MGIVLCRRKVLPTLARKGADVATIRCYHADYNKLFEFRDAEPLSGKMDVNDEVKIGCKVNKWSPSNTRYICSPGAVPIDVAG